jgi:PST family polysaccharide transporter
LRDQDYQAPERAEAPPPGWEGQEGGREARAERSYAHIVKTSAMIGGATVLNLAVGILRTKAMAVLLGPAGMGLMGLFSAIAEFAQSVAGLGVVSSGVRQIAEAAGSGDERAMSRTAVAVGRTSLGLGVAGALVLALASWPVARLTFGDAGQAGAVAWLSLAVLMRVVADGQSALLQGRRRIADLARMGIAAGGLGAAAAIASVYLLGERGIVPSLIAVAGANLLASWWFSRRLAARDGRTAGSGWRREVAPLLKLGFVFMASSMMMAGSAYLIRTLVSRSAGLDAAGLYQSAWAIGGLYVGIVLQAMGADFYPRLTGVACDNEACNRLVNEQARASLLLAGPGVIGTLALAPLVIGILYSPAFQGAVEVLRWLCLGMALRILAWPLGFIVLVKGAQGIFFWTEIAWTLAYLALAWVLVGRQGLNGAGMAFFLSYVFYYALIRGVAGSLSGFRWTPESRRNNLLWLSMIGFVFTAFLVMPAEPALLLGLAGTLVGGLHSLWTLAALMGTATPEKKWLRPLRRLLPAGVAGGLGRADEPAWLKASVTIFMIVTPVTAWAYWMAGRYGVEAWGNLRDLAWPLLLAVPG